MIPDDQPNPINWSGIKFSIDYTFMDAWMNYYYFKIALNID